MAHWSIGIPIFTIHSSTVDTSAAMINPFVKCISIIVKQQMRYLELFGVEVVNIDFEFRFDFRRDRITGR